MTTQSPLFPSLSSADDEFTTVDEVDSGLDDFIAEIDAQMAELPAWEVNKAAVETHTAQYILFTLASTDYAVSIDHLLEIGRPLDQTRVPNTPDWLVGVANLRGDIISVVDLRQFLGLPKPTHTGRMLIVQDQQQQISTALLVDKVNGIRTLDPSKIEQPTAPLEDQSAAYLQGIYETDGNFLVILDLDKLLLSDELQQF